MEQWLQDLTCPRCGWYWRGTKEVLLLLAQEHQKECTGKLTIDNMATDRPHWYTTTTGGRENSRQE